MRIRVGLLCLFAGWMSMSMTVMAHADAPDLLPVVIDAAQGTVEIRNIGDTPAQRSQVFVICSKFDADSKHSEPCSAGLSLPGYIGKWNALPYDVPDLPPGGSYRFQVFGAGAFPHTPGSYGVQIIADSGNQIAESNEQNNNTRLDSVVKAEPGIVKLIAHVGTGRPEWPIHIVVRRHATDTAAPGKVVTVGDPQLFPHDIYLPPGSYDIRVTQRQTFLNSSINPQADFQQLLSQQIVGELELGNFSAVTVEPEKVSERTISFKQPAPGKLMVHTLCDGEPARAYLDVSTPDQATRPLLKSYPAYLDSDVAVNLLPGRYELKIEPEDRTRGYQGHGYRAQTLVVEIEAGKTSEETVTFTAAPKGRLVLTSLVDGSRGKAEIGIRPAGSTTNFGAVIASYNLFSLSTGLLPGHYDIQVRPLEVALSVGGVDVFHGKWEGPGLKTRRVDGIEPVILHDIEIRAGEVVEKTVEFETSKDKEKR